MLSYQHIYHAGNLADVHKHSVLSWTLAYLTQKDKPLSYIETHAGRGIYDLTAAEATKTGEAAAGIVIAERERWFAPDHPYADALEITRSLHGPNAYPGSPLLAAIALRETDSLHLAELHPQEVTALRQTLQDSGAHCRQQDGFAMALALTPPTPRRGIMLIDPSYEIKTDYQTIPGFIQSINRKWNVGLIMLWYPILPAGPHLSMLGALQEMNLPGAIRHEVQFPAARDGHGLIGSGLFVVNPVYGMAEEMARVKALFA